MFTGLVETLGRLVGRSTSGDVDRLEIEAPEIAGELRLGESVAVCGACLTVASCSGGRFVAEMMPETRRATRLGRIRIGARLNLERALRLGDRLDGHWVAGHVDGVGRVLAVESGPRSALMRIRIPPELAPLTAPKGSVAVEGVSLTLIEATGEAISVGLIPETLLRTTLGELRPDDEVNLEADLIARYVRRLLCGEGGIDRAPGGLGWGFLAEHGWV